MNELLSTDQLFPLVRSSAFSAPSLTKGANTVLEITHGVGCMGSFETDTLNLAELELAVFQLPYQKQEAALLMNHSGLLMECLEDDFLVRRNELLRL